MQKFIITKYAMTTGVFVVEGVAVVGRPSMIKGESQFGGYYHKPHWHVTPEAAIARVQVMRTAALASLRKKVAKLEAMDIEAAVRDVAT